ncbi:MAG: hypothetical protein WA677_14840 [Bradyrhizobium sp.]|jgi:hypothetical protein
MRFAKSASNADLKSLQDDQHRAGPALDPPSRGVAHERYMSSFNPPVQKHSFADRFRPGKKCLETDLGGLRLNAA